MTELRDTIAKNICELRTEAKMTQLALAEVLNYSDKAVSKWERAESVPDIFMLKRIADYFGVSVDYLLEADHSVSVQQKVAEHRVGARNRFIISLLATSVVWLVATFVFVVLLIAAPGVAFRPWLTFICAIPTSSVVCLVFNSIWGRPKLNYFIISVLVWTLILAVYMTLFIVFALNVWQLFILGIPGQVIILVWSGLTSKKKAVKLIK